MRLDTAAATVDHSSPSVSGGRRHDLIILDVAANGNNTWTRSSGCGRQILEITKSMTGVTYTYIGEQARFGIVVLIVPNTDFILLCGRRTYFSLKLSGKQFRKHYRVQHQKRPILWRASELQVSSVSSAIFVFCLWPHLLRETLSVSSFGNVVNPGCCSGR